MMVDRRMRVAVLCAVLVLDSCYRWVPAPVAPVEVQRVERRWGVVRVRRTNGETLRLVNPRIERDTLIGNYAPSQRSDLTPEVRVALADVTGLDMQHLKRGETIALVAALSVTALGLLALLTFNMGNPLGGMHTSGGWF